MKRAVTIFIFTVIIINNSFAQEHKKFPYPVVGDTIPNHTFTDLLNYPKKQASISDFRGKWLILDFWGYSCSSCLASFPKMNKLSQKFGDKVQIIMVGCTKSRVGNTKRIEAYTKKIYGRLANMYNLKFTVAFDSVLYLKHDIGALPHLMVLNPNGVLVAKAQQIDSLQMDSLVSGTLPKFERQYSNSEGKGDTYNWNLPLLTIGNDANGGKDTSYLYRSLLKEYTDEMPVGKMIDLNDKGNLSVSLGKIEAIQYPLTMLYRLAYIGVNEWLYFDPRYHGIYSNEISYDSASIGSAVDKKIYAYSLNIPKRQSSKERLMKIMQHDLENYFGYTASLEKKQVPVYFLEISDQKKVAKYISPMNGEKQIDSDIDGLHVKNVDLEDFLKILAVQLDYHNKIIIKTGMKGVKVNIDFKANLLDQKDIVANLIKYGFSLTNGFREMQIITLRKIAE